MSKISELDPVAEPDGTETVVVLKDGVAKRAGLLSLVSSIVTLVIDAAITAANATLSAFVSSAGTARDEAVSAAAIAGSILDDVLDQVPDKFASYPRLNLENAADPVVQADGQVQSSQTRDGRELRVRPDAMEGVDRGSRYAAFVQPGTGNLIVGDMTSGASITIPRVASWAGGPTLDYQLAGWAGGLPLIATSRALKGPMSLMMASTAGMAPAFDPKVMYITFTVGQSTGADTNGKHFDATHLYAPMTMPPAVFMPQRNGHSDLRCARYSDWDSGLSVPTDPTTITGIMPFGPRPLPNNTWTSQVFGDGMLSRILKVLSDRFHAVHGRRQPMLGASLAFGGISNLNRSKTGAANIPGYSITAYANNLQIMTAIRDRIVAAGYTPVVLMVFDAHGETGAADTNYAAVEAQYQTDLNADIRSIFGQAGDPIWVEAGITSAVSVNEVESLKGIRANHNNGKILIASVDYELLADQGFEVAGWPKPPNPDYVHLANRGYHRRGESAGHVGADMLCLNRTAKMTQPVPGAALTNIGGNVWRWPFESESGTIEIAAAPGFDVPAHAGVTYRDSGGGALINSVALAPGGTGLDITMSTDVSARLGREWRIAMNGKGEGQSHGATAKCRSPVRDPVSPGVSEATGATRWRHTLPAHAN